MTGSRRAALLLPAVLLLLGLAAGGALGWRAVTGHTVRAAGPPPPPALVVRGAEGPIAELRGLGELAWIDDDGVVRALAADGTAQRTLGRADQLGTDPSTNPGFGAAGDRAVVSADGATAYGYLGDGSPVAVRLADGRLRRLSPPGTRAAVPLRLSADGAVAGVCTGKAGKGPGQTVGRVTTVLLDGQGRQLASLPDCLLDLAADGGSAHLPDPGQRLAGDPDPGPTRGLRLWRRSGGRRTVLAAAAVLHAARFVAFDAKPKDFAVADAWLAPDGRRALVSVYPRDEVFWPNQTFQQQLMPELLWPQGGALLLVDLASGRWQAVPAEVPGAFPVVWGPTGGFAYGQTYERGRPTVAYVPPGGQPVLLEGGHQHDNLQLAFSPDGDWLLLPDAGQWTFIRVDDPATRVTYLAPGSFAGWLPGRASP